MTRNSKCRIVLTSITAFVALLVVPAQAAPRLVSHLAVYELSMTDNAANSGISDLRGRIVYELTGGACAGGYTVNMRIVNSIADADGAGGLTDLRSSAWESADGRAFRFNTTEYLDSKLSETTSGSARRDAASAVAVNLEKPTQKDFAIARDVAFPLEHLLQIIDAAQNGQRIVQRRVYDGSQSGDKIFQTTTVIGRPDRSRDSAGIAGDKGLIEVPAWPVSIAYFEEGGANGGEEVPSYQISFRLFDNGVSDRLILDYGQFTLKGALKSVELIEDGGC